MRSLTSRLIASLLAGAAALAVAGCSTTPAPTGSAATRAEETQAEAPPPPPAGIPLVAGMAAGEVESLLGKPADIRPMEVNGLRADVWVYLRPGQPIRREVTTGMREVHYVDPISGRELTRQEAIMGYVTETPQLELRLLMFKGSLINWSHVILGFDQTYA